MLRFMRIVATTVDSVTKAITANLDSGIDGADPDAAAFNQTAARQPIFSALGLVVRPRPPGKLAGGQPVHTEVGCDDQGDGYVPFTYRDLRLNAVYSNPKDGSVALVGYGGGFHSIEDTTSDSGDQKASVHVIYAPYQFSNGVPAKAHVVTIDTTPGNESISLVHGEGHSIQLVANKFVSMIADANTWVSVSPDNITIQGKTIALNGSVALGNALTAVPLAPGASSTRVAISPT